MIQKLTPKKFVTDKDERLVAPNEMILAENVTISEREDGSYSILKPMKGTDEIDKATGEPTPPADWTVVGSVSDDQRGRVYFFVYDDSDDSDSRIMMFDQASGEWKTVFSDDDNYLNFSKDYPVKGDVINKAFDQDGVIQTALYFTDNYNEPKKINVDRALAGDYDQTVLSGGVIAPAINFNPDYAFTTIKAQPRTGPYFSFETDPDFTSNNFKSESFQFACQYIYKDGEESAFSSFSSLAVSPSISSKNLTNSSIGSFTGNVCLIKIPWQDSLSEVYIDVDKVRIVARSGNNDPFFVIDEFDPRQAKTRDVGGSSTEVYNASTSIYRFYNDSYYANIAASVSGKNYDNVPQKAQGQSISGSRLIYSNYTEGYKNFPEVVNSTTLSVVYGEEADLGGDFLVSENEVIGYPNSDSFNDPGEEAAAKSFKVVVVDILSSNAVDYPGATQTLTTPLPDGTVISIGFRLDMEGKFYSHPSSPKRLFKLEGEFSTDGGATSGGSYDLSLGVDTNSALQVGSNKEVYLKFIYKTSDGDTVSDALAALKTYLDEEQVTAVIPIDVNNATFEVENVTANPGITPPLSNGDTFTISGLKLNAVVGFDDVLTQLTDNDGTFAVNPYIKKLEFREYDPVTIVNDNGGGGLPTTPDSVSGVAIRLDNFTGVSNQQVVVNEALSGSNPDYIVSRDVSISSSSTLQTFKAGCTHELGIVYYDKWGRAGFVNPLGSVYVKHPSERSASEGKGNAALNVRITNGQDTLLQSDDGIPWADRFQIVYGGSQFSNVFQYTTGGGYMVQENDGSNVSDNTIVESDKRIFVSLKTLEQFRDQTSTAREYSFTKGDICRVISYNAGSGRVYPSDSDGNPIEFEVMGVERLSESGSGYQEGEGNPIQWNAETPATQGDFLVLKAPRVDDVASTVKYTGFDWFSIVKYWATTNGGYTSSTPPNYPDGTTPTASNFWGKDCLIEILTPKKSTETPIYYEIGDKIRIGPRRNESFTGQGIHGPDIRLFDGDVMFRNVSCRTSDGTLGGIVDPGSWEDKTIPLECEQPDETSPEKAWGKGKAHTTFERAATVNRYNGITYSEPYADDASVLSLSSFVPSQANFFDLPSEYGACNFLGTQGDNLLAIQENKVSRLSINKSVLETGTQGGVVALSNKVINNMVAYAGDFGTTNPESVLIRDGVSYFVDAERRAIIRITNQGLQVISDKDAKSQIADRIISWEAASGSKTIISGYDAEDDIYYATLSPVGSFDGYTIGYDDKGGFWQGTYTFMPDRYVSLKDGFYAFKSSGGSVMHEFGDRFVSNRFFDTSSTPVASKIEVVANANPSMVKVFRSLSTESNSEWGVSLRDSKDKRTEDLSFREVEGAFYGDVEGAITSGRSYPTDPNDIYYTVLGKVDSISGADVTLSNNLKGINIPLNGQLFYVDANGDANISVPTTHYITSVNRGSSTITIDDDFTAPAIALLPAGTTLLVAQDAGTVRHHSNKLRDRYAIVKAEFTPTASVVEVDSEEIYAVNVNFENSPLNDAIGKQ